MSRPPVASRGGSAPDLRALMADFAQVAGSRAPLYARFAAILAESEEALDILAQAPEESRLPVTLLAAIHDLLLADPGEELAQWYPNLNATPRADDPSDALLEFCARRRRDLTEIVRSRVPQTNEIGRSALLMIGLAGLADEVGPLTQLDVGASAGLNLMLDRFAYDYQGHRLGSSSIVLHCQVRGPSHPDRLPSAVPMIDSRLGLDARPIDLDDPDQVRWLEACVWPDQADRFNRLRSALAEAARARLPMMTGDAVDDVEAAVARLGPGHPVVTTSWVLNYLGQQRQRDFLEALGRIGRTRDLSLVSYEAPALTPGLGWPQDLAEEQLSALRVWRWRSGSRSDAVLAVGHPHGYWLRWR